MDESKQSSSSHEEDERFLSRSYRSKGEFIKEYERFYYGKAKAKDLYFLILTKLQKAVEEGNIDKFKRFVGLIDYISGIENAATLENYHNDTNNPIKRANFVILACKYDRIKILKYVFSNSRLLFGSTCDVGKDSIASDDKDESNHDAFYYAIRSGNTELLDTLITKWPGDYFGTRPEHLDEVLSRAYEELKFRNVSLSDEIGTFVENKLINLRFFSNTSGQVQSARDRPNNITERVDLVLENIDLLKTEYSNDEKVDERFLFVARFIAQNIHVLKRQLRLTYDRLPWEEIEFCLVTFISSYVKKQEINLFYRTILNKTKLLIYLENFARKLENCKFVIHTVSIGKLSDLPKLKREDVVAKIIKDDPEFTELYVDYQQIRDTYSLERISSYLNLALSINPEEREGQLIITRALQVIGEYLKNTLESPNLSASTSEFILLLLPKHTRKIVIDLRNSLSHVYSLSKRTEIEENANANFFIGVQQDTKRIDDVITDILYSNKTHTIRYLLNKVITSDSVEEIKEVAEVMNNVEVDRMMSHKSVLSEHEKLEKLLQEWSAAIPEQTNREKELFSKIDEIINFTRSKSENIRTDYSLAFTILKGLSSHLSDDTLDRNFTQNVKTEAMNAFESIVPRIESCNLKKLLNLSMDIFHSVKSRIKTDDFDKINRSFFEINVIVQLRSNDVDMKWIEKLRERICDSTFPVSKHTKTLDMTDDQYDQQLTRKLSELKNILKQNVSGCKLIENLPSHCQNKKLLTVVEMLVLDIMSILDRSEKYLENNLLFLDDNTPLLTGKCLRNHLAHGNTILEVLLSDPSSAVLLNAEKLVSENVVKNNNKVGKLVKDDPSKLKDKFDRSLITIAHQENMFSALQKGDLEELKTTLRKGADIHARTIDSWSSLHLAACSPNLAVVKFVLDLGFDANVKDSNGQSPFHIAATHGSTAVVKFFVEKLALPVDDKDDDNRTPLHLAAKKGHKSVVEMLLKNNADTNIIDRASCYSPLHYAVQNNHLDVFEILLEKETNVDVNQVLGGYTSLQLASEYGRAEMVDILLKKGANVDAKHDKEGTALHAATIKGHLEIVDVLIRHGTDVNVVLLDGSTALLYAVQFDHEKITEILLKHGANVNAVDKFHNESALHYAAENGRENIVEMLLMSQANVNLTTAQGLTPLHMAAKHGHLKIATSLIEHGSDIRARSKDSSTPLHLAARAGHLEIAQLLIKNGAEVDAKSFDHSTPLLLAAQKGHADVVDLLLKNKAGIDNRNVEGNTPIFIAARHGHKNVIEVLLENKVDVNVETNEGWAPLHLAAQAGHLDVVAFLLENKADLEAKNVRRSTPLHAAVVGGHKETVNLLLEKGAEVNAKQMIGKFGTKTYINSDGITPLHLAVELGRIEIVEILVANGADVNAQSDGLTPLHSAILTNKKEIVDILLAHGAIVDHHAVAIAIQGCYKEDLEVLLKKLARIDGKDEDGTTLLHAAARRGHKEIVKALITRGAEVNATCHKGITPLYIAALTGAHEVAEILIDNGANVDLNGVAGTPLHAAVVQGHDSIVDMLLSNGANINVRLDVGDKSTTPLEAAVAAGHLSMVKTILRHRDVDLNAPGKKNWTLLHIAAHDGKLELVKFLVDKGSDLHAKVRMGSKCIHIAAVGGHKDVVEFLLTEGLDIHEPGANDRTPLHYAVLADETEVVNYLISKGANVNAKDVIGHTPLHVTASSGSLKTVRILLENGACYNAKDHLARKPLDLAYEEYEDAMKTDKLAEIKQVINLFVSTDQLFEAVKNNCDSDVEKCIKTGAFVNAKSGSTETSPLHYAAWKGFDRIVDILLQNKADPNAVCSQGFTPLHYSASLHPECTKALMLHGAVYNAVSNNGKIPSDFVKDKTTINLFKIIDESFTKIKNGNVRVIDDLNKMRYGDTLKIVMNARNRENKTLTAAAALIDLKLFEKLKGVSQDDGSAQIDKAMTLMSFGQYQKGLDMLTKLYEKRKTILGPDNPAALEVQTCIGKGLYKQGKYHQALNLFEEILVKQNDLLGSDNKDTLDTRSSMALIMQKIGREEEASSIYQEVYPKQREILGPKHKDTLSTHCHMAEVYLIQRKYDQALPIYRSVYENMKETLGRRNPATISCLNNIAITLSQQGKTEEALKIYDEVLSLKRMILGNDHADTLRTLQNVAGVRLFQKKYHEAMEIYQEVLAIQKKNFPPNYPETLNTQFCIGNVYFEQGKYISALKAYKDCINQRKVVFGPNDPSVAVMLKKIELIHFKSKWEGRDPSEMLQYLQRDINVASSDGNVGKVQRLLNDGVDVNDKDIDGRTPLHYAVDSGHLNIVNILLENGADVTQATNKGNTPLHTAASKGHEQIVNALLKHVSRDRLSDFANAKTFSGGTASIHVAAKNGFLEVVKCLLNHGAIYNIANKEGKAPIDLAKDQKIIALFKLIEYLFEGVKNGNVEVISKFKTLKQDEFVLVTNARNNQSHGLVQVAVLNKRKNVANMLLQMLKTPKQ